MRCRKGNVDTSMMTCTKCISDIFMENELNTRIGAHTCKLSANIDKKSKMVHYFPPKAPHNCIKSISHNASGNFWITHLKNLLFITYALCACHHRHILCECPALEKIRIETLDFARGEAERYRGPKGAGLLSSPMNLNKRDRVMGQWIWVLGSQQEPNLQKKVLITFDIRRDVRRPMDINTSDKQST